MWDQNRHGEAIEHLRGAMLTDPNNGLYRHVRERMIKSRDDAFHRGVAITAAAGLGWFVTAREAPAGGDHRISRFTIDLPKDSVIVPTFNANVALSADGTHLAYTPLPGPVVIRRLDSLDGRPLEASAAKRSLTPPFIAENAMVLPSGDQVGL